MASERLQVILQLITGQYQAGAARAATATQAIGTSARAATTQAATMGTKLKGLAGSGGGLLAVAGGAFAAKQAFDGTIGAFASFDDAMTQSLAIMGNVSTEMRQDMSDAAREVAKVTTFSADQAAESYFFLASAGLDAAASIEAMPAVAQFAQAGMFDMALATDLLTDAQSALGLASDDAQVNLENMVAISDVLVRANQNANASVQQFSEALTNRAGPALRALDKDVEEGVAVLAALADQGIKGSEAGQQLGIVLRDLQTKALSNADAFREAGIAVFDATGNMRNIGDVVGDLEGRLDGMSDAQKRAELSALGFSDRSIKVLTTLLGTSDAIREYETELRSAGGATEEVAEKQLESASKQWELFLSGLQDVGLEIGENTLPALLDMLPALQDSAESFGEIATTVAPLANVLSPVARVFSGVTSALTGTNESLGKFNDATRIIGDTLLGPIGQALRFKRGLEDLFGAGDDVVTVSENIVTVTDEVERSHREAAAALFETNREADLVAQGLGEINREAAGADRVLRQYADGVEDIGDEASNAAPNARDMAEAIAAVNNAAREAADPIFAAVGAVNRYEEAIEAANEDGKVTNEEMLELAELALDAQGKLADLGAGNVTAGIQAIADALDVPQGVVAQMLEDLGIIDASDWSTNLIFDISMDPADRALLNSIRTAQSGGGSVPAPTTTTTHPNIERHTGGPGEAGVPYTIRPDEEVFIPHSGGDFLLNTEVINALKSGQTSEGGSRTVINVGNVYGWEDFVEKVNEAGVDIRRFGWG